MQSHCSSSLHISNFISASSGVGVSIEELSSGSSVLWEVRVLSASIEFLVVVNHMVSLWGEELVQFLVLKYLIQNPHFVDCWLSSLVSDSGKSHQTEEGEVHFPNQSLVEHEEREGSVGKEGPCPAII